MDVGACQVAAVTRREFMTIGAASLFAIRAGALSLGPVSEEASAQRPADSYQPQLQPPPIVPEKNAQLHVMRWAIFAKGDQEQWEEKTRNWEKQTGGKVLIEYVQYDAIRPKAAMTASIGAGPDMVLGWYDDPHLYPDKLLDVSAVANYLGKKYGGWHDLCRTYGYDSRRKRWIAIPMGGASSCVNYRESWVKEAGWDRPPGTMDEFLKLCKKLKQTGHPTGFALGHAVGDANVWTHWCLWAFGGKAVEKDGKTIAINRQETWQALEYARELYDTMIPGVTSWLDPDNNKAFLSGQISLTGNGISIYTAAQEQFPEIANDMNHVNFPVGPIGHPTEFLQITQAMIFKHTRFPNAAKHYVMFMCEDGQFRPWIEGGHMGPNLKYYSHLEFWTRDPKRTPFRDVVLRAFWSGYAGPLGPASAAALMQYVIVDMFAAACTRQQAPREAARVAEERLARIYRKT
jgi:multiple sugar transport system substrate-binding protein